MEKTVYIHIGSPKTGSSSIQNFLTVNNDLLFKNGLFYPLIGTNYSTGFVNGLYFKDDYKKNFFYNNLLYLKRYILLKKTFNSFMKSDCHSLLFSDENLFFPHLNFCEVFEKFKFFRNINVKIILYYRRSIEYLSELWAQIVKSNRPIFYNQNGAMLLENYGYSKKEISEVSLISFLRSYPQKENLTLFKNLISVFGKGNIILKSFEKEEWVKNNLLDDFFSIFSIELDSSFKLLQSVNLTPNRVQMEKINYMNKFLPPRSFDLFFKTKGLLIESREKESIVNSLPDAVIKEITDLYYQDECNIANNILGQNEMFSKKYPSCYGEKRNCYSELHFTDKEKKELQETALMIKENDCN